MFDFSEASNHSMAMLDMSIKSHDSSVASLTAASSNSSSHSTTSASTSSNSRSSKKKRNKHGSSSTRKDLWEALQQMDATSAASATTPTSTTTNTATPPSASSNTTATTPVPAAIGIGNVCSEGPAFQLPAIAGLTVQGVGQISMPLCGFQARQLVRMAQKPENSPLHNKKRQSNPNLLLGVCGNNCDTVLSADAFQIVNDSSLSSGINHNNNSSMVVGIENPAWSKALDSLMVQACTELGIPLVANGANAQLDKLLLIGAEGGSYHTSPTSINCRQQRAGVAPFATLMVQLPSRFTGGTCVVSNDMETQDFQLGEEAERPYACHYVVHYADCDCEIRDITSGQCMMLVYSLYLDQKGENGDDNEDVDTGIIDLGIMIPAAEGEDMNQDTDHGSPSQTSVIQGSMMISAKKAYLKEIMNRLAPKDRLLVIPIDITNFNLHAVAIMKTIQAASDGRWKAMIAQAEKVDTHRGYANNGVMDIQYTDRGQPQFCYQEEAAAVGVHGRDCTSHLEAIGPYVNFDLVGSYEGGDLLLINAKDGSVVKVDLDHEHETIFWAQGQEGPVQRESRETDRCSCDVTYRGRFIVAYSVEDSLEIMYSRNPQRVLEEASKKDNAEFTSTFIAYLKRSGNTLTASDAMMMHPLKAFAEIYTSTDPPSLEELDELFAVLSTIDCWSNNGEIDARFQQTMETMLQWLIEWSDNPTISAKLLGFFEAETCHGSQFLWKADLAAHLQIACSDSDDSDSDDDSTVPFSNLMNTLCNSLENSQQRRSSKKKQRSPYSRVHFPFEISALIEKYPWNVLKPAIVTFVRCMMEKCTNWRLDAELLSHIEKKCGDDPDMADCFEDFTVAFAEAIFDTRVWCSASDPLACQAITFFYKHADEDAYAKLAQVAEETPKEILEETGSVFDLAAKSYKGSHKRLVQAWMEQLKMIMNQTTVSECKSKLDELVSATKGGKPVFSWSMEDAQLPKLPMFEEFLRSPAQSKVFRVDRGMDYAKKLESRLKNKFVLQSSLHHGFSATIRVEERLCDQTKTLLPVIVIVKTKDYYRKLVKEHEKKLHKIEKVECEMAGSMRSMRSMRTTEIAGSMRSLTEPAADLDTSTRSSSSKPGQSARRNRLVPSRWQKKADQ